MQSKRVQEYFVAWVDYHRICSFRVMKKGGFCNFYVGYGHKFNQPSWCEYDNANLCE